MDFYANRDFEDILTESHGVYHCYQLEHQFEGRHAGPEAILKVRTQ